MSDRAAIEGPESAWPLRAPVTVASALKLAIPASLASMATPLLGAADVWALGLSSRPLDIAAVGLGSIIFSLAYWTFGFIRMGVAGLTAQAIGAEDELEARDTLTRGLIIGGAMGLALTLLQWPLGELSFHLLGIGSEASAATFDAARDYFYIRIWGAPFALATYAIFGWLTARGRTDYLMIASLAMTFLNIALDWYFVTQLGAGAGGVAAGTLVAEIFGFLVGAALVADILRKTGGWRAGFSRTRLVDPVQMKRTVSVNTDIFIRTGLLAFCFAWFTQRGGAFGDVTLAANQTLMQLFLFTGLALDGTAIAAETLVGQSFGRRDRAGFSRAIFVTSAPALVAALFFVALYFVFGEQLVALLVPEGQIRAASNSYLSWVMVSPLAVLIAFQLDGIFIGATRAREMRNGMIISTLIFLPASLWLAEAFGNHGLWAAFMLYFVLRGLTLGLYMPRLFRLAGA